MKEKTDSKPLEQMKDSKDEVFFTSPIPYQV